MTSMTMNEILRYSFQFCLKRIDKKNHWNRFSRNIVLCGTDLFISFTITRGHWRARIYNIDYTHSLENRYMLPAVPGYSLHSKITCPVKYVNTRQPVRSSRDMICMRVPHISIIHDRYFIDLTNPMERCEVKRHRIVRRYSKNPITVQKK